MDDGHTGTDTIRSGAGDDVIRCGAEDDLLDPLSQAVVRASCASPAGRE
jgi:hypothetical protein